MALWPNTVPLTPGFQKTEIPLTSPLPPGQICYILVIRECVAVILHIIIKNLIKDNIERH